MVNLVAETSEFQREQRSGKWLISSTTSTPIVVVRDPIAICTRGWFETPGPLQARGTPAASGGNTESRT